MPLYISMCGQKGGSGKTTLAVSLATELTHRGLRTLLVDADPQGTATTWSAVAAEAGYDEPPVIGMGDAIRAQLPVVARDFDRVVIDCPPRAGKRTVGALAISDLAILPCGASPPDLWALTESLGIVAEMQAIRPELAVRVVMNGVHRTSTLGPEVTGVIDEHSVPRMKTIIYARVPMARAMAAGRGVTLAEPSSLAAGEVREWTDEVERLLGEARA